MVAGQVDALVGPPRGTRTPVPPASMSLLLALVVWSRIGQVLIERRYPPLGAFVTPEQRSLGELRGSRALEGDDEQPRRGGLPSPCQPTRRHNDAGQHGPEEFR